MKKVTVLLGICVLGLAVLSSCNSKKSAGQTAKAHHEKLQNQNYAGYVDAIYVEEDLLPAGITADQKDQHTQAMKQQHAQILKQKVQPAIDAKGGIKDVTVKSEKVASNGKTADVVLTNTYNNGDKEDLVYTLVYDEPSKEWKVKMGRDKEVWKTVLADGTHESFKLKETDDREVWKAHLGDERDFVKEIDGANRQVEKVKVDGEKEVHKVIEKEDEIVVKDKVNGEKEVTRIPKE